MRKTLGAAALMLAVAAPSGWAQTSSFFIGRATPSMPITNVPIDTSTAIAPAPTFQQATSSFSLSKLFSAFHFPSFPPFIGQSNLPAPSSFPSTHYPNKLQPVKPIIPGQQ